MERREMTGRCELANLLTDWSIVDEYTGWGKMRGVFFFQIPF